MASLFFSTLNLLFVYFAIQIATDVGPIFSYKFRRRSIDSDYLDFVFDEEPQNVVISPSNNSANFPCKFRFLRRPQSVFLSRHSESDEEAGGAHSAINKFDPLLPKGLSVDVNWRKDGVPLSQLQTFGRLQQLDDGSLAVRNAIPIDDGYYQCAIQISLKKDAKNSAQLSETSSSIFLSRRAHLQLPSLSRFEQQPVSQKVAIGGTAAFRCILTSYPKAQIQWFHNNVRLVLPGDVIQGKQQSDLQSLNNIEVLPITQTLVIRSVEREHSGTYRCLASNGKHSRTSQTALLEVVVDRERALAPVFVLEPQNQLASAGDSIILECLLSLAINAADAKGGVGGETEKDSSQRVASPSILWLHDDTPLSFAAAQNESGSSARVQIFGGSSLLIDSVESRDAGRYTCRFEARRNDEDVNSGETPTWNMLESTASVSIRFPPKIVKWSANKHSEEGTDVEFECVAEGLPQPRLTWYRNGDLIVPSEYFQIASNRLWIFGLVREDQAVYQCLADNELGSDQKSTQLIVVSAASPSSSINGNSSILPPLWQHLHRFSTTPLPLVSSSVFAAATVENSQQVSPLNLHVTSVKVRSITLQWKQTQSQIDDLFEVLYRELDDTKELTLNVTAGETSVTLNNLQPGTSYYIKVQTRRRQQSETDHRLAEDIYRISDTVKVATLNEDLLPGPVRDFRATVLGSETIRLDWSEPTNKGGGSSSTPPADGPIRYRLFYSNAVSSSDHSSTTSNDNKLAFDANAKEFDKARRDEENETQILMLKTSYTLHGLHKNAVYQVRVEAETQHGAGPSTPLLRVRTFSDVPTASPRGVSALVEGVGVLHVSWLPPLTQRQNGALTGYKLRYKAKPAVAGAAEHVVVGKKSSASSQTIVVDGASTNAKTIDGLQSGIVYSVRVAAMNQNGTGPFSEWIDVQMPHETKEEAQIAGVPLELRVIAGKDFVRVRWSPPTDEGVMIRGYTVGWGINVPDVERATVDADQRQFTIRGLRPNREYVVSLRAFNRLGNGFPIYETIRTISASSSQQSSLSNENDDEGDVGDLDGEGLGGQRKKQQQVHDAGGEEAVLSTPVAVFAEVISSTAIRLSWVDPNDEPISSDNQFYTIRYGISGGDGSQFRQLNTTDVEHLFDGLRPHTQYEFAVKIANTDLWSMSAVNRTLPAPPSSPPRDISVKLEPFTDAAGKGTESGQTAVKLSWHTPKYANGEIEEYIVLYTDQVDRPDRDWLMDSVRGDQTAMHITGLDSNRSYFFKLQARNSKGYGPFSSTATFVPAHFYGDGRSMVKPVSGHDGREVFSAGEEMEKLRRRFAQLINENYSQVLFGLIGALAVLLVVAVVLTTLACARRRWKTSANNNGGGGGRKAGNKRNRRQQLAGRKLSQHYGPGVAATASADLECLWEVPPSNANGVGSAVGCGGGSGLAAGGRIMVPLVEYGGMGNGGVGGGSSLYLHQTHLNHHHHHHGSTAMMAHPTASIVQSPPVPRFQPPPHPPVVGNGAMKSPSHFASSSIIITDENGDGLMSRSFTSPTSSVSRRQKRQNRNSMPPFHVSSVLEETGARAGVGYTPVNRSAKKFVAVRNYGSDDGGGGKHEKSSLFKKSSSRKRTIRSWMFGGDGGCGSSSSNKHAQIYSASISYGFVGGAFSSANEKRATAAANAYGGSLRLAPSSSDDAAGASSLVAGDANQQQAPLFRFAHITPTAAASASSRRHFRLRRSDDNNNVCADVVGFEPHSLGGGVDEARRAAAAVAVVATISPQPPQNHAQTTSAVAASAETITTTTLSLQQPPPPPARKTDASGGGTKQVGSSTTPTKAVNFAPDLIQQMTIPARGDRGFGRCTTETTIDEDDDECSIDAVWGEKTTAESTKDVCDVESQNASDAQNKKRAHDQQTSPETSSGTLSRAFLLGRSAANQQQQHCCQQQDAAAGNNSYAHRHQQFPMTNPHASAAASGGLSSRTTPQMLHIGNNDRLPLTKVEFASLDNASSFGGSQAGSNCAGLGATPPPPPIAPPVPGASANFYGTTPKSSGGGMTTLSSPLIGCGQQQQHRFTSAAIQAKTASVVSTSTPKTAHVVRPVVFANLSAAASQSTANNNNGGNSLLHRQSFNNDDVDDGCCTSPTAMIFQNNDPQQYHHSYHHHSQQQTAFRGGGGGMTTSIRAPAAPVIGFATAHRQHLQFQQQQHDSANLKMAASSDELNVINDIDSMMDTLQQLQNELVDVEGSATTTTCADNGAGAGAHL